MVWPAVVLAWAVLAWALVVVQPEKAMAPMARAPIVTALMTSMVGVVSFFMVVVLLS
ncbi:MAG: hypothetical protein KDB71_14430 [Mycobacterium sp.]|nr:hypothetical protein [Mycobacterium sp.]